jgi:hypothetical protein
VRIPEWQRTKTAVKAVPSSLTGRRHAVLDVLFVWVFTECAGDDFEQVLARQRQPISFRGVEGDTAIGHAHHDAERVEHSRYRLVLAEVCHATGGA